MLNLFIAVIVNAMQAETDHNAQERADRGHEERNEILKELANMRLQLEKRLPPRPEEQGGQYHKSPSEISRDN